MRSKKDLEKEKQNDMIIPEEQSPIETKIEKEYNSKTLKQSLEKILK